MMTSLKKLSLLFVFALLLLLPNIANAAQIHTVQAGETVSQIARRYETTVDKIVHANDLRDPNRIYVGQRLVIPSTADRFYRVVAGDTLWSIASRHGVTVEQLAVNNGLNPGSTIYVGQTLVVPPSVNTVEAIRFHNDYTGSRFYVNIAANSQKTYEIYAQAGQLMEVRVQGGDPGIVVRNSAGQAFGRAGIDHAELVWREYLPRNGRYTITLYNNADSTQQTSVTVVIPKRISFAPGGSSYSLTAPFAQPYQTYIFHATEGQTIGTSLYAVRGSVVVRSADGTILPNQFIAPYTGDYTIQVGTAAGVQLPEFTLTLFIVD